MQQRSVEPTRPPAPRPVDDDERIRTVEQLGVLQTSRDDPHRDAIVMLVSPPTVQHQNLGATHADSNGRHDRFLALPQESTNSQAQEVVDFNSRIQCSQFGLYEGIFPAMLAHELQACFCLVVSHVLPAAAQSAAASHQAGPT